MTWADTRRNLKIFLWYLVTEPWRQLKDIYFFLRRMIISLNKLITVAYVSFILAFVCIFTGKRLLGLLLFGILFTTIIIWEYKSGIHIYKHRQAIKEKVKKGLDNTNERNYLDDQKKSEDLKRINERGIENDERK